MFSISQIAQALGHSTIQDNTPVTGFNIDTRSLKKGQCFVALVNQRDGHNFIAQAQRKGAAMALVEKKDPHCDLFQLIVKDSAKALAELARQHRATRQNIDLIALTGSCGKTTTRALLQNILEPIAPTLSSIKSYNNHLGVPLTLLRLKPTHRYVIQEMGANHPKELAYLTQIAKPKVALITNAAPVHLEGFGSLLGVAQAKAEIFEGLTQSGVAIINADDPFCTYWRGLNAKRTIIMFGYKDKADIQAQKVHINVNGYPNFLLATPKGKVKIKLNLLGKHNVMNALAATTAAYVLDVDLAQIQQGLETACAIEHRLQIKKGLYGCRLLDDSYNANPQALKASIELLSRFPSPKILVLGDMVELGEETRDYHQKIGLYARQHQVDQLYCLGMRTRFTHEIFGPHSYHFTDKGRMIEQLKNTVNAQTTVLIKGSFSMKMGEVVNALVLRSIK